MVSFRQVVVSRRDDGIRKWTRWLREDLSSRPYAWLRPDFVPPSPNSLLSRILRLSLLRLLLSLILLMLSFGRPGCLISVGLVILLSLLISSWILLVIFCLRRTSTWIFLGLRVGICRRLLGLKSLLLVVWMVGLWNDIKALSVPWCLRSGYSSGFG